MSVGLPKFIEVHKIVLELCQSKPQTVNLMVVLMKVRGSPGEFVLYGNHENLDKMSCRSIQKLLRYFSVDRSGGTNMHKCFISAIKLKTVTVALNAV